MAADAANQLGDVSAADILACQELVLASGLITAVPLIPLGCGKAVSVGGQAVDIRVQAENLQRIGSFKLRAAIALLAAKRRSRPDCAGVITASAGNMGQAVAFLCARERLRCECVVPEGASAAKIEALRGMGAVVTRVPMADWWQLVVTRNCEPWFRDDDDYRRGRLLFAHPVAENAVLAGNATIAATIAAQQPDVDLLLVPFGGGGLSVGIALGLQRLGHTAARVYAVEVEGKAPVQRLFSDGAEPGQPQPSGAGRFRHDNAWIDGIGSSSVLDAMQPLVRRYLAGSLVVTPAQVARAVLLLLARNRMLAEGAGAAAVAAALTLHTLLPPEHLHSVRNVVCVVSGGGLALPVLSDLISDHISELPAIADSIPW